MASVSFPVRLLLWSRGRRSSCPGRLPEDCQTLSSQNVRHIVIQRRKKLSKHETLNKYKTAAEPNENSQPVRRFTYLPWAEVKRSSERGAAISLPLPFRARALESAAVASRSWTPTEMALFSHPVLLQQRQGNGRHSGSSRRKVIPWWYLIRRPTMSATAKPVSFGDGLLNAPHSAFVSRQQGELLPSYWYIFDSSAGVLHQKPK